MFVQTRKLQSLLHNWYLKPSSLINVSVLRHPIRVVERGNYHVIVYHVYSGVQHPMISMLFIP